MGDVLTASFNIEIGGAGLFKGELKDLEALIDRLDKALTGGNNIFDRFDKGMRGLGTTLQDTNQILTKSINEIGAALNTLDKINSPKGLGEALDFVKDIPEIARLLKEMDSGEGGSIEDVIKFFNHLPALADVLVEGLSKFERIKHVDLKEIALSISSIGRLVNALHTAGTVEGTSGKAFSPTKLNDVMESIGSFQIFATKISSVLNELSKVGNVKNISMLTRGLKDFGDFMVSIAEVNDKMSGSIEKVSLINLPGLDKFKITKIKGSFEAINEFFNVTAGFIGKMSLINKFAKIPPELPETVEALGKMLPRLVEAINHISNATALPSSQGASSMKDKLVQALGLQDKFPEQQMSQFVIDVRTKIVPAISELFGLLNRLALNPFNSDKLLTVTKALHELSIVIHNLSTSVQAGKLAEVRQELESNLPGILRIMTRSAMTNSMDNVFKAAMYQMGWMAFDQFVKGGSKVLEVGLKFLENMFLKFVTKVRGMFKRGDIGTEELADDVKEVAESIAEGVDTEEAEKNMLKLGFNMGLNLLKGIRDKLIIHSPSMAIKLLLIAGVVGAVVAVEAVVITAAVALGAKLGLGILKGIKNSFVGDLIGSALHKIFDTMKSVGTKLGTTVASFAKAGLNIGKQFYENIKSWISRIPDMFHQYLTNARQIADNFINRGQQMFSAGMRQLTAGGVFGFFQSQTFGSFADFDKVLAQIQIFGDATSDVMKKIEQSILSVSQKSPFKPEEVAAGVLELQRAGLGLEESMAALPHVLDLAITSGMALGDTTNNMVQIIAGFGLGVDGFERVANALVGAADISTASVEGLTSAMGFVSPVASAAGISIEDTAAALALLNDRGIDNVRAGTGLRAVLTALIDPTNQANGLMKELGISTQDSAGNFVGLEGILGQFKVAVDNMRKSGMGEMEILTALSDLGESRAISAFLNLIETTDDGTLAFTEYRDSMDEANKASVVAQGIAASTRGLVDKLTGSWKALMFKGLRPLIDNAIEPMINGLTKIVQIVGQLPSGVLGLLAGLGLLATVMITINGLFLVFGGVILQQVGFSMLALVYIFQSLLFVLMNPAGLLFGIGALVTIFLFLSTVVGALIGVLLPFGVIIIALLDDLQRNSEGISEKFSSLTKEVGTFFQVLASVGRELFVTVAALLGFGQAVDEAGKSASTDSPIISFLDFLIAKIQALTSLVADFGSMLDPIRAIMGVGFGGEVPTSDTSLVDALHLSNEEINGVQSQLTRLQQIMSQKHQLKQGELDFLTMMGITGVDLGKMSPAELQLLKTKEAELVAQLGTMKTSVQERLDLINKFGLVNADGTTNRAAVEKLLDDQVALGLKVKSTQNRLRDLNEGIELAEGLGLSKEHIAELKARRDELTAELTDMIAERAAMGDAIDLAGVDVGKVSEIASILERNFAQTTLFKLMFGEGEDSILRASVMLAKLFKTFSDVRKQVDKIRGGLTEIFVGKFKSGMDKVNKGIGGIIKELSNLVLGFFGTALPEDIAQRLTDGKLVSVFTEAFNSLLLASFKFGTKLLAPIIGDFFGFIAGAVARSLAGIFGLIFGSLLGSELDQIQSVVGGSVSTLIENALLLASGNISFSAFLTNIANGLSDAISTSPVLSEAFENMGLGENGFTDKLDELATAASDLFASPEFIKATEALGSFAQNFASVVVSLGAGVSLIALNGLIFALQNMATPLAVVTNLLGGFEEDFAKAQKTLREMNEKHDLEKVAIGIGILVIALNLPTLAIGLGILISGMILLRFALNALEPALGTFEAIGGFAQAIAKGDWEGAGQEYINFISGIIDLTGEIGGAALVTMADLVENLGILFGQDPEKAKENAEATRELGEALQGWDMETISEDTNKGLKGLEYGFDHFHEFIGIMKTKLKLAFIDLRISVAEEINGLIQDFLALGKIEIGGKTLFDPTHWADGLLNVDGMKEDRDKIQQELEDIYGNVFTDFLKEDISTEKFTPFNLANQIRNADTANLRQEYIDELVGIYKSPEAIKEISERLGMSESTVSATIETALVQVGVSDFQVQVSPETQTALDEAMEAWASGDVEGFNAQMTRIGQSAGAIGNYTEVEMAFGTLAITPQFSDMVVATSGTGVGASLIDAAVGQLDNTGLLTPAEQTALANGLVKALFTGDLSPSELEGTMSAEFADVFAQAWANVEFVPNTSITPEETQMTRDMTGLFLNGKLLGAEVVEGINTGMEETDTSASTTVVAQGVIDAFQSLFGIASPSTVATTWGQEIINGLNLGLLLQLPLFYAMMFLIEGRLLVTTMVIGMLKDIWVRDFGLMMNATAQAVDVMNMKILQLQSMLIALAATVGGVVGGLLTLATTIRTMPSVTIGVTGSNSATGGGDVAGNAPGNAFGGRAHGGRWMEMNEDHSPGVGELYQTTSGRTYFLPTQDGFIKPSYPMVASRNTSNSSNTSFGDVYISIPPTVSEVTPDVIYQGLRKYTESNPPQRDMRNRM